MFIFQKMEGLGNMMKARGDISGALKPVFAAKQKAEIAKENQEIDKFYSESLAKLNELLKTDTKGFYRGEQIKYVKELIKKDYIPTITNLPKNKGEPVDKRKYEAAVSIRNVAGSLNSLFAALKPDEGGFVNLDAAINIDNKKEMGNVIFEIGHAKELAKPDIMDMKISKTK